MSCRTEVLRACERGGNGPTARSRAAGGRRQAEGTRLPSGHPGHAGAGRRHGGDLPPVPVAAHRRLRRRGRLLRDLRVPDHRPPAARVPEDRQGRPARLLGTARQAARARGGPRADRDLGGLAAAAAGDAAGGHRLPDQGQCALLPELAARGERGQLPQGGQRGEPGPALLVALGGRTVLPGLAAAVPPRGARGAHRAAHRGAKACSRAPRGPAPGGRDRRRLALVLGLLHARQPGGRLLRDHDQDLGTWPRRPARAAASGTSARESAGSACSAGPGLAW